MCFFELDLKNINLVLVNLIVSLMTIPVQNIRIVQ